MNNAHKSFTDMLKERRSFVSGGAMLPQNKKYSGMGGGNPMVNGIDPSMLQAMISGRDNYLNSPNGVATAVVNQAKGDINNGVQGVPISPADAMAPVNDYISHNEGITSSLLGSLAQLNQAQAGREQEAKFHNDEMGLQREQMDRENYMSGYDPTRRAQGVDPVTAAAQNIINGVQKLTDVPPAQKTRVASKLKELGYDPGGQANSLVNSLEKMYFGGDKGKDTLSFGAGALNAGAQTKHLGSFLDSLTNGEFTQRRNLYKQTKEGFGATLKTLTGDTGVLTDQDYSRLSKLLPDENDTEDQAQKKIKQLRTQINAKFNPGKNITNGSQKSAGDDPLGLF